MDIKEWLPEFKVSSESDTELMTYFVKTKHLDSILNNKKWLVLGRKGTGKTAIYEYLKNTETINSLKVDLNFKDYPWPIHFLYKENLEGEMTAYYKSWRYIIVTKCLSTLISFKKNELNVELKNADKLIQLIYGNPDPSLTDIIKSKLLQLNKISLPSLDAFDEMSLSFGEISFEEVPGNIQLKNKLKSNAFTLLEYFEKILINNITGVNLTVLIDQLDENWLSSELAEYSKILINLINVSQSINHNKILNKSIRVVVFLRTDIYDTLRFNDKTKIFQDSAIEIMWDAESLNELFLERIKKYKPVDVDLNLNLKSSSVFEVKTVRHGATPITHILRRSFYRPRDIISYFNEIRKVHSSSKSGLYVTKDLYAAEKNYSINVYGELIDEWVNQKEEISQILNVIQNIGIQEFSYDEFSTNFSKQFNISGKSKINECLSFLFQNSLIGQKRSINWEYFATNPYLQIDFSKQFHVNNGLKSRLMLTEKRKSRK